MAKIRSQNNCVIIDRIPHVDDVVKLGQGKFAYVEGSRTVRTETDDRQKRRGKRQESEDQSAETSVEQL